MKIKYRLYLFSSLFLFLFACFLFSGLLEVGLCRLGQKTNHTEKLRSQKVQRLPQAQSQHLALKEKDQELPGHLGAFFLHLSEGMFSFDNRLS